MNLFENRRTLRVLLKPVPPFGKSRLPQERLQRIPMISAKPFFTTLFIAWFSNYILMKICIIYHSESGNTRHVAQHIASACNGKLIEITDKASYNRLTGFLVRCKMARGEEKTPIEPVSIDVSGYDQLVFGSPVWAFKPTPAIHAAIDALKGCEGKKATAFCTHGGRPGQTAEVFRKWIEARGMKCVGNGNIHQDDIENEKKTRELVSLLIKNSHPS